jgi:hypothetical protein
MAVSPNFHSGNHKPQVGPGQRRSIAAAPTANLFIDVKWRLGASVYRQTLTRQRLIC